MRIAFPCYIYPLYTLSYNKLGYAGLYIFFLILQQTIDCGYSESMHFIPASGIYVNKKNVTSGKHVHEKITPLNPTEAGLNITWASFRNENFRFLQLWKNLYIILVDSHF